MSEDRLRRQLATGEVLFRQGQQGHAAFVIESGVIEIFSERDEVRQVIARLGVNDIFGEMALLGDAVRTASACAVEPTQLLVVTHEHLNERLLGADPMTRHLLRTVVLRCREMLAWMRASGATRAAPERTAFVAADNDAEHADRELAFGRLRTEQELELALERREFKLYFQPIVRLSDRKVAGFEALIRWFKPGQGMVPPGEFIPVAEASPLINRIGLWILETAFDSLLEMDSAASDKSEPMFLTVNLSARQLSDPELLPALAEQVKKLEGRDCRIKLEITESLMIGNVVEVQAFIARCRELGVEIVLDDFGTGYCSLSYLHLFEVHTMKLDRSFVRGMAVSDASEKVVLGVTRMAHDLGLSVVVEGVEGLAEADQAAGLGIDYVQGYFYGRPAPLADALKKLKG
ncbi:MAG: EAL domain-containing protein [Pseudomonadota bacterium]